MKKLKTFAFKKPILFSILLMIFALMIFGAPTERLWLSFCDKQYATLLEELTNNMVVSMIVIILSIKLNLFSSLGLTVFAKRWKDLLIAWPLIILILISAFPVINGSLTIDTSKPVLVGLFTLMNFFIGLSEELLVRGVILCLLLMKLGNTKKGIYICVIVSSVIFGSAHIGNLIANPSFLIATLSQIVYATFFGIFFAACVLRSKTIWPMIVLHAAIDFFGQLQQIAIGGGSEAFNQAKASTNLQQALSSIVLSFIFLNYGLFILRKVTVADIQNKFSNVINKNSDINLVDKGL